MAVWVCVWGTSMKISVAAVVIVAGLTASAVESKAEMTTDFLLGVTGKVLINKGKGFEAAQPAITIQSGYDIFIAEGASATIHFSEANCEVALPSASVTHVTDARMCQLAMLTTQSTQALRGSERDVVITPVNGEAVVGPAVAGEINPYFIAGGIFAISTAAFVSSVLEKPVTAP
jgi:hypothetical protein